LTTELKVDFPPSGSKKTAAHSQPKFSVKEYAGAVFSRLRQMYRLDEIDICLSLENHGFYEASDKSSLRDKSNSVSLNFSSRLEILNLQKVFLKKYLSHFETNPESFLRRIYGIYKIRLWSLETSRQKLIKNDYYFLVLGPVFNSSNLSIHRSYQLTGGRVSVKTGELGIKSMRSPLLHQHFYDEEFVQKETVDLGDNHDAVLSQLFNDILFLADMKFKCYNVHFGIHDFLEDNRRLEKDLQVPLHPFLPYSALKLAVQSDSIRMFRSIDESRAYVELKGYEEKLSSTSVIRRNPTSQYVGEGRWNEEKSALYYICIDNIFGNSESRMSSTALTPDEYASRFCKFLSEAFKAKYVRDNEAGESLGDDSEHDSVYNQRSTSAL